MQGQPRNNRLGKVSQDDIRTRISDAQAAGLGHAAERFERLLSQRIAEEAEAAEAAD